jgi:hypothetical protein
MLEQVPEHKHRVQLITLENMQHEIICQEVVQCLNDQGGQQQCQEKTSNRILERGVYHRLEKNGIGYKEWGASFTYKKSSIPYIE